MFSSSRKLLSFSVLACSLALGATAATAADSPYNTDALAAQTEDLFAGVVTVTGVPLIKDGQYLSNGLGSGWIVRNPVDPTDKAYYVITNNHVAGNKAFISVELCDSTGAQMTATYLGSAPVYDVAVLKINTPVAGIRPFTFGSDAHLKRGYATVTLGAPNALKCSASYGRITGFNRVFPREAGLKISGPHGDIQTDAAINHGNSGGPLVSLIGGKPVVIGMNTYIVPNTNNLGFAIPAELAKRVMTEILTRGAPMRGLIGAVVLDYKQPDLLKLQGVPAAIADAGEYGVQLGDITPGGIAEAAGLKSGDVILRLNGAVAHNGHQLIAMISSLTTKQPATLLVQRGARQLTLRITPKAVAVPAKRPAAEPYTGSYGFDLYTPTDPQAEATAEELLEKIKRARGNYVRLNRDGSTKPTTDKSKDADTIMQTYAKTIKTNSFLVVGKVYNMGPAHRAYIEPGLVIVGIQRVGEDTVIRHFADAETLQKAIELSHGPLVLEVYSTAQLLLKKPDETPQTFRLAIQP